MQPLPEENITSLAGVDARFGRKVIYTAAVVLDYATQEPIEQVTVQLPLGERDRGALPAYPCVCKRANLWSQPAKQNQSG